MQTTNSATLSPKIAKLLKKHRQNREAGNRKMLDFHSPLWPHLSDFDQRKEADIESEIRHDWNAEDARS